MVEVLKLKKNLFKMVDCKKYWYRLLKHYDSKNYFHNGLTLPFIIGSRLFLEPNKKLQTVEELINEFNTSDFYINVLKCDGIGEYVFRISDFGDENIYRKLENFVIPDYSFSNYSNINQLINELEQKYNQYIFDKRFSKIDGEWKFFSEDLDIPKLDEIK